MKLVLLLVVELPECQESGGFPTSVTKTACCIVREIATRNTWVFGEIVLQVGRMRGSGVPGVKVKLDRFSEFVRKVAWK